jgi:hypothetical protein
MTAARRRNQHLPINARGRAYDVLRPGEFVGDLVLGPPLCRIYERSAVGPLPPTALEPPSFGVFVRRASKMLGWWMRSLARLFNDSTNAPYSVPRALTRSERAAI